MHVRCEATAEGVNTGRHPSVTSHPRAGCLPRVSGRQQTETLFSRTMQMNSAVLSTKAPDLAPFD